MSLPIETTDGVRDEDAILENEPIQISLAGRVYDFAEPGARTCRKYIAKSMRLEGKYKDVAERMAAIYLGLSDDERDAMTDEGLAAKMTPDDLASLIEKINDMLDFLVAVVSGMEADRDVLDQEAGDGQEIKAAYDAVVEVLTRPTRRTPHETAPADVLGKVKAEAAAQE